MSSRSSLSFLSAPSSRWVALCAVLFAGAGCNQRLTPPLVRELLDEPKGRIAPDTMAQVTRDLFLADRATAIESLAQLVKRDNSSGSGDGSANAVPGLALGILETTGDVFCVGGLVASAAAFDACDLGQECDAELTIDSCILRVGDDGVDEDARGKLKFKLKNRIEGGFDRSELGIAFEGWESTRDDAHLDAIAGELALETSRAHDDSHIELVFASDIDMNIKRKQRGFLDDGIEERARLAAGVRFIADRSASDASGSLEVLAFADLDGGRDESVVIRLAAEGHRLDAGGATASASLEVIGENGTFSCTWSGARSDGTRDGVTVKSEGECVDEDGETFSFRGEATGR
jgi:hypothetical protein